MFSLSIKNYDVYSALHIFCIFISHIYFVHFHIFKFPVNILESVVQQINKSKRKHIWLNRSKFYMDHLVDV